MHIISKYKVLSPLGSRFFTFRYVGLSSIGSKTQSTLYYEYQLIDINFQYFQTYFKAYPVVISTRRFDVLIQRLFGRQQRRNNVV